MADKETVLGISAYYSECFCYSLDFSLTFFRPFADIDDAFVAKNVCLNIKIIPMIPRNNSSEASVRNFVGNSL